MDKRIEIATIDKTTIFRPSFINSLQGRLYRHMEKSPKGKKFRIIIEPVETQKSTERTELTSSVVKIINKYVESHQLTSEEIELLKEIPLDDMKQMVKLWWDEFISGGITDDSK